MKNIKQLGLLALLLASYGANAAPLPAEIPRDQVVIQVSDNVPAKWTLALNNAKNMQDAIGKDKVDIEIVAYGPGIDMLKMESEAGVRIDKAIGEGIKILACQNTMKAQKLTQSDMLPSVSYVPAGVVEIIRKEKQGWAYLRP
jgi:hypothetical protein